MPVPSPIPQQSETLAKGLKILDLFHVYQQGLRLTDISRTLGINKTTISRFVNTYCRLGYLKRDPTTKLLRLGPRSIALAYGFLQNSDLADAIGPVVDDAHETHGLHIDVGLLHGDSIFLVYRRESGDTHRFRHFTSARGLHYLATGKAALAFLPPAERCRVVKNLDLERMTAATIVDKTELLTDLEQVVKRGYSCTREEYLPGLIAIGAPLINLHHSRVMGGLSFDSTTTRYTMSQFERKFSPILVELAKAVSAVLPAV